ncbi:rhodanese-like domain-containing protein [Acerihabitans arboris]|uniref:Thiosulfate sulfurtransferase n=1 Tax=Acerihabitans arboris TaxID=2691583 RepID=A0A845SJY1_9GAMM|nr:rhodanese-like domain-containing protein [Acerihabitans arboris]NDL63264.1 thiosulfate sulfurtransferase [Acerihabitans arboris]
MTESFSVPYRDYRDIRRALLDRRETALVDVRAEALFAEGHPLFAVNMPLERLVTEALSRIPRLGAPVTLYDNGGGLALAAARRLTALGYRDVALLKDGLAGWKAAGGELFADVNSPSKAFGELVEHHRRTPSMAAPALQRLLDERADLVVLDVRRFDEYHTMSIPGSISVPGAELVLRAGDMAPSPNTLILVNCAGRTRSIIGTQSLINAGVPNPVAALRNGTIGWMLAGQRLEQHQSRRYGPASDAARRAAAAAARGVAQRAGAGEITAADLRRWLARADYTTYVFDVRSEEEYAAGHFPASRPAPGGQLVQETDHYAAVRGARIVLVDDADLTRANMTASWLAQMGWRVWVLDGSSGGDDAEYGAWVPPVPAPERGAGGLPSPRHDRYRRPYEGLDNSTQAMQAYLDWEAGLVAQLDKDGTHGFFVI